MKKRILCLTLGLMLTISQAVPAGAASRKDQLKQDKAAAQSQTRNRHFPLRSISWILIW